MKIHIKTSDFYSWFRSDLKIGGENISVCLFEIMEYDLCVLKFGRGLTRSITLSDFEWCQIFTRYLESKNLICEVGQWIGPGWGLRPIHNYIGQEPQRKFDLTLLVKMNGESSLDNIGIEL